jgi:hypothetical protein
MTSARAVSGTILGASPAGDGADVHGARAEHFVYGERHAADHFEHVQKLEDGGFAEFGVGRVGHAARCFDLIAQGALGTECEMVFGGLAVDQKTRAAGFARGAVGAGTQSRFVEAQRQSHAIGERAPSACGTP